MKLAQAHNVSAKIVLATLYKDVQLSKKTTMHVTKMLYEETKKERLRTCEAAWP
jgi:hypothetical protein